MGFYFNDSLGCFSLIIILVLILMFVFSVGKAILFSPIGIILLLFIIWRNLIKSMKKKEDDSKVDIKWQEKTEKGPVQTEFWDDDNEVVEVDYEEIDK